jgi:hypothetical protein
MYEDLVSVIIPCYNYGHFVADAIGSALSQNYSNVEIVVCDDGSTDNSVEVIKKYPDVKLIQHSTNLGLPAARNDAIKASTGKYIIPLDADDMLLPTAVESIVDTFHKSDASVGIVRFGLVAIAGNEQKIVLPPGDVTLLKELETNHIFVSSSFPKQVWEEVGGYSEELRDGWEDWEFWVKILEAGYKVATLDRPLFIYRIHKESKGHVRSPERSIQSRHRFIHKHYDAYRNEVQKMIAEQRKLYGNIA